MRIFIILFIILIGFDAQAQLTDWLQYEEEGKSYSLQEYLDYKNAPGLSFHFQFAGRDSSLTLGWADKEAQIPITANTSFEIGNSATSVLYFMVLRMVHDKCIELDAPVNKYLKSWKIPENKITKRNPVTVRDLLLNRRGFKYGYKPNGYKEGEALPNLGQILRGEAPAKTAPVILKKDKNKDHQGDYAASLILQQLVEDYYDNSYQNIIQKEVFGPLDMTESFFATELSESQKSKAAVGYLEDGSRLVGDYYRYPELATSALWTTPRDYIKLVRYVLDAARGRDNRFLSVELAKAGISRQNDYRSLLFHVQEDGLVYWGGNAKGYFFNMQAHVEEDWIMAGVTNSNLNWPLVGKTLWQGGAWMDMIKKGEEMIIFTNPEQDAFFSKEILPQLKKYCRDERIQLKLQDARKGMPSEITATPALVFQNPRGRAIFGGRYTELSEIQNFVRVNRYQPREGEADQRTDILQQEEGRFVLALPLKMTEIKGVNAGQELASWQSAFQDIYSQTLGSFRLASQSALQATDRRFYLDIHPYIDEDLQLYISFALFSQFNCIRPIYSNFGQPLTAKLADRDDLFAQIANQVQEIISNRMADPAAGDAMTASSSLVASWDALGLVLPVGTNEANSSVTAASPAALNWAAPKALSSSLPVVQFRFPSPLDRYAGEIPNLVGGLQIDAVSGTFSGEFEVKVNQLTMGMQELDTKVLKYYLKAKKYPQASFRFSKAEIGKAWQNGEPVVTEVEGTFRMMDRDHPVLVKTQLLPYVDAKGQAQLRVEAAFQLNISNPFGLPGPDGPEFAKTHLDFDLRFLLTEKGA